MLLHPVSSAHGRGRLTYSLEANSTCILTELESSPSRNYSLNVPCRGTKLKDADGIERHCYPLLAFWIADRKAANALLNIKHHPAYYSDPWDLVHRDSLDQYNRTFEPRTAAAMKQVRLFMGAGL